MNVENAFLAYCVRPSAIDGRLLSFLGSQGFGFPLDPFPLMKWVRDVLIHFVGQSSELAGCSANSNQTYCIASWDRTRRSRRVRLTLCPDVLLPLPRVDHDIPNDVLIERPGPNELIAIVQGDEDLDTLMWREGLEFDAYDLLHIYTMVAFPPLRIREPTQQARYSSLDKLSQELDEGAEFAHELKQQEETSSSSSSLLGLSGSELVVAEAEAKGKKMLTSSSSSCPPKDKWKTPDVNTSHKRQHEVEASSVGYHVAQDVANLNEEDGVIACNLNVMQLVQALQRATTSLECEKKCFVDLKRAQKKANSLKVELKKKNEELVAERSTFIKEYKYVADVKVVAIEELVPAHAVLDKPRGSYPSFRRMPPDHPALVVAMPLVAFPDSLELHLLIILSGFNEDAYANQSIEEYKADGRTEVEDDKAKKDLGA
ncbi:hypothetical protein Acr_00g0029080 [Actinidia rufa]|uniref:Uncharacterized protein n=1 Tax=Actinidia rufa TaxID=165716 RepID=A0A7J0DEY9_9ERIC|nr:hypothetical protein Acr_00g0029080 [Actinidia rufa]